MYSSFCFVICSLLLPVCVSSRTNSWISRCIGTALLWGGRVRHQAGEGYLIYKHSIMSSEYVRGRQLWLLTSTSYCPASSLTTVSLAQCTTLYYRLYAVIIIIIIIISHLFFNYDQKGRGKKRKQLWGWRPCHTIVERNCLGGGMGCERGKKIIIYIYIYLPSGAKMLLWNWNIRLMLSTLLKVAV